MSDHRHENAQLRIALEASKELAESRRLELVKLSSQLDELLRLAAAQNEQLSDMRAMLRRKLEKRGKVLPLAPPEPEDDPDPPSTPAPVLAAADKATPAGTAATSERTKPTKDRKPRAKGTGRRPLPDHLDVLEQREGVCACGHCGTRTSRSS